MKEKLTAALAVAIIVFVAAVPSIISELSASVQEAPTAESAVIEMTVPTVEVPEATVEETQPIVNNSVNDVDTSVEATEPAYSQEELDILSIIIYQEAGGDSFSDDTRRKVGSVFLNRVESPHFPDTFEAVATARQQYGTLYWTGIKWPDRASNSGETHAVERAYRIAKELLISGSILPHNVVWQAEFFQGDGLYIYQDGFYFCYTEVKE